MIKLGRIGHLLVNSSELRDKDQLLFTAKWLYVGAVLYCLVSFGHLICKPVRWLVGIVPDDTFYYLNTARHIAASGVSSFDGINPTNGYHPAWMLFMVICAKLVAGRIELLRACIGLSAVCHVLTSLVLVRLLNRFINACYAWTGGAIYVIYPLPMYMAVMGLETSLYILSIAVAALTFHNLLLNLQSTDHLKLPSHNRLILFGLSLSGLFWARTEGIVYAVAALFVLLSVICRVDRSGRNILMAVRTASIVALTFAIAISPWLLYSFAAVGHLNQDSGTMKILWNMHSTGHYGMKSELQRAVYFFVSNMVVIPVACMTRVTLGHAKIFGTSLQGSRIVIATVLSLVAITILVPVAVKFNSFRRQIGLNPEAFIFANLFVWLSSSVLATGLIYGLLFQDTQAWYAGPPGFVVFFCIYVILLRSVGSDQISERKTTIFALATFGVMCLGTLRWQLSPQEYPWQRDVYDSQSEFELLIPADARIGCFNAGIPAYFSTRTVINLDGLVNDTVVKYWVRKDFGQYLLDAHISYICDEPTALDRAESFSSQPLRLQALSNHRLVGWNPPLRYLWRVTEVSDAADVQQARLSQHSQKNLPR